MMPASPRRMTHREAVDLQGRYVARKNLPEDLMRLVLAELVTLTAEREKAGELLGQLRTSWPALRDGLAEIDGIFVDG